MAGGRNRKSALGRAIVAGLAGPCVLALAAVLPIGPTGASAVVSPDPQERVASGAAPWMVALSDESGNQFCGGTLVRPTKVVTAAHCAVEPFSGRRRQPGSVAVIIGRPDLRTSDGMADEVGAVWVHPGFRGVGRGDDVAVLTLSTPVTQPTLPIVAAHNEQPYRPGTPGKVYGWGRTSERDPQSPVLRSVDVPVSPDSTCAKAFREFEPAKMFCAGVPEGGRDACAGDSGGPFVINGQLAGIVSFGSGCGRAGYPGIYTRLSSYAGDLLPQL